MVNSPSPRLGVSTVKPVLHSVNSRSLLVAFVFFCKKSLFLVAPVQEAPAVKKSAPICVDLRTPPSRFGCIQSPVVLVLVLVLDPHHPSTLNHQPICARPRLETENLKLETHPAVYAPSPMPFPPWCLGGKFINPTASRPLWPHSAAAKPHPSASRPLRLSSAFV